MFLKIEQTETDEDFFYRVAERYPLTRALAKITPEISILYYNELIGRDTNSSRLLKILNEANDLIKKIEEIFKNSDVKRAIAWYKVYHSNPLSYDLY